MTNDARQTSAMLVDSRTAARMLAVSPRKLWSMTFSESPRLPHVRLGRLVRYDVFDLQDWVERQRQTSN